MARYSRENAEIYRKLVRETQTECEIRIRCGQEHAFSPQFTWLYTSFHYYFLNIFEIVGRDLKRRAVPAQRRAVQIIMYKRNVV